MDNNINQINMDTTTNFINSTYDDLSYFDLYGNSVIIFMFMTLFVFLVYSYCKIMQTKEDIASDWVNQRCKPQNIAFAGFITHPEGTTPFQYTNENFQYCVQNILTSVSGYALEPFQFMMKALNDVFNSFASAIQQIREVINRIRNSLKEFATDVLSRILNIMIPIQKMFIALMDTLNKIQGVMVGGLYTMLGSYYTLQALMGAIMELIIKILVALVIIIVGLWIMPFTWPVAASMSAVFLAIAIPMAIIIYFMSEVLHVKSSGLPSLRCFDKNTQMVLYDKTVKSIEDIEPGARLFDGSTVTAKITVLSAGLDMYTINGITVSGSHIIRHNGYWVPVRKHPNAVRLLDYNEPLLFCLNTSNKAIVLNNMVFTDWDEIYDDTLEFVLNYKFIESPENISKVLDYGFNEDAIIKLIDGKKYIKDVIIGDILLSGGVVYGIVELDKNNLGKSETNGKLYHLLVSSKCFEVNGIKYSDYNNNIDSVLELRKILSKEYV
jgi:hypothetical protein